MHSTPNILETSRRYIDRENITSSVLSVTFIPPALPYLRPSSTLYMNISAPTYYWVLLQVTLLIALNGVMWNLVHLRWHWHLFSICWNEHGIACVPRRNTMSNAWHGYRKLLASGKIKSPRWRRRASLCEAIPLHANRLLASSWFRKWWKCICGTGKVPESLFFWIWGCLVWVFHYFPRLVGLFDLLIVHKTTGIILLSHAQSPEMVEGLLCLAAQMAYCEYYFHLRCGMPTDRLGTPEVSVLDRQKYMMFLINAFPMIPSWMLSLSGRRLMGARMNVSCCSSSFHQVKPCPTTLNKRSK